MTKVLLTGFAPFGGDKINPSWEAVKLLPDKLANLLIVKKELPVEFGAAKEAIYQAIAQEDPDYIIAVGVATSRSAISIEKVAINYLHARIPDNTGAQPQDKLIEEKGPVAYFATLPVQNMVANIKEHKIPCVQSLTAGAYVCNYTMYEILHLAATKYPQKKAGFIHVPAAPEQVVDKEGNIPSMSIAEVARGLTYGLEALK